MFTTLENKTTQTRRCRRRYMCSIPACLVSIPAEEHGVLQEEDRRHQREVAEPEGKREKVDVEQSEVQEEHLPRKK